MGRFRLRKPFRPCNAPREPHLRPLGLGVGRHRSAEVSRRPAESPTPRPLPLKNRGEGRTQTHSSPNGANIAIPSAIKPATRSCAGTRRPRRSRTASSIFPRPPIGCPIISPNSCCFRTPATTTSSNSTAQRLAWAKQRPAAHAMLECWRRLAESDHGLAKPEAGDNFLSRHCDLNSAWRGATPGAACMTVSAVARTFCGPWIAVARRLAMTVGVASPIDSIALRRRLSDGFI